MFTFILDECVPRQLANAVADWNAEHPEQAIDLVSVGEPPDLPLGSADPDIIRWAERNARIVVTTDYSTMPTHLKHHLAAGGHLSGMLLPRPGALLEQLVQSLVVITYAGSSDDLFDTIMYIPL
jgi:hypothetical protein